MAEFDPISAINPAALGEWARAALYLQYEPEFRTLESGEVTDRSTLIRFPLFVAALPVSSRGVIALSASTLLDRSWSTRSTGEQTFDTTTVGFTDVFESLGAINDVRLGGSYAVVPTLRIGLGLHAITGQNRLMASRTFDDAQVTFAPFAQATSITYAGSALSAGIMWRVTRTLGLAASAKKGFGLTASVADTTIGEGKVPDRVGGSIRFQIATGTEIVARAEKVWWSRLTPLSANSGSGSAAGRDAWEIGGGIEGRGPVLWSRPITLRLGGDRRTLPFLAAGAEVTELLIAGGFGMPLAFGRSSLDASVQRAAREADIGVSERAWTLSVGLTVRP